MTRPLIYTSGAYTADTETQVLANVQIAQLFSQTLITMGAAVFCPHTHSHGLHGLSHSEWLEVDKRMLSVCDAIFMLPNWAQSEGAQDERTHAMWLRLPVIYALTDARKFIERWRKQ